MKQERFTEQAQEALAASQELVRQYHHSQWDVEHILLALLQQQAGLVGDILKELDVDVEINSVEPVAFKLMNIFLSSQNTPCLFKRNICHSFNNIVRNFWTAIGETLPLPLRCI